MTIKKIIVIFKTHLDIGFTDFSANVTKKYMESYLPGAATAANELKEKNGDARLVWTTGSWLIEEYLRTHSGKEGDAVRKCIQNGDICWHGLPFTTHTELMSAELLEYGLSISKKLDETFGKKTIAAKMTDVPGHTKAMIPFLKKAGIEFLHIGVNPASSVPCVPPLFRWQADNGDMITVMYQTDYGEFAVIEGTDTAVYFAHTGDNLGVQSTEKIEEIFAKIHTEYPDAEIKAGNLNDLALAVREVENTLPIITDEIGDTWIHGVGTDPKKVSQFRALERLYAKLPDGDDKETLARGLIMIPEHTWGLDVKTHLNDHEHYDRDDFNEIRKTGFNYLKMEKSWREQRAYITDTVEKHSGENRQKALELIAESERNNVLKRLEIDFASGTECELGSFKLKFNPQGEIISLTYGDKVIADRTHRLLSIVYEQFCADDYKRFFNQYNRIEAGWAYEDFTKPGIEDGSKHYIRFEPERATVSPLENGLLVRYTFDKDAHKKCGCPLMFDAVIWAEDNTLKIDLAWFSKPANRAAEAIWFGFKPIAENKRISKFGQLIDPKRVVENGQCRLHATDFGVAYDGLTIETVDTALVAPQYPSLLNFTDTKPLDSDPVYFNLYNNIWGTNFPMWYEDNARFRFNITVK